MRDFLISIWFIIDPLYLKCTRLTFPSCKERNIFRVRLTKYKGRNIILSDGTLINKNDTLVKIHLHNVRLLKEFRNINSEIRKAKMIYRYVQMSLPGIENYIQNHTHSKKIKGIVGITMLIKGSERLGFEIIDISHPIYKWFKRFAFLPIEILSSKKTSAWDVLKHHNPSYLFMSTNKLSKYVQAWSEKNSLL
ncbi:YkoP family protein [Cytobacillus praedii]|uniref:YkoP family protein n=1 Tax=Cytobacillus praedii TaxID=1742358 RepID=UPI003F7DFBAC